MIDFEANISTSLNQNLKYDRGSLTLAGWTANGIERVFGGDLFRWDSRTETWRCHAIHYQRVVSALTSRAVGTIDEARDFRHVAWGAVPEVTLREEQAAAVENWSKSRRGIIVMPTGTGKTEVALELMRKFPCSTLVVSPVRDLMYQWHRRILRGLGYDAGILGDSQHNIRPVTVTTYDSACIHMANLGNRFEFLIFDECHHLAGGMLRESALLSIAPQRLGLTATLERTDGRHIELEHLIGPVEFRLGIESVKGKTLADYDVIRIPVFLSDDEQQRYSHLSFQVRQYMIEQQTSDPKFDWKKLCANVGRDVQARRILKAYRAKQAIEDRAVEKLRVIEDLFRLHIGSPTVIFAGSNAMARDISLRFLIPCLLNHCGKKERLDILDGLQDGSYPAVVANQVLDEGVDFPAVKIAIVVGGSSSSKQAQQRLGRILRKSGDSRAVLYEVVCKDTHEEEVSRRRRANDAYTGTRHRRVAKPTADPGSTYEW